MRELGLPPVAWGNRPSEDGQLDEILGTTGISLRFGGNYPLTFERLFLH
jgi:hypothetical protein